MTDYSELKAAALAATPGTWVARADGWTIRAYPDSRLAGDGIKVVHTCSVHMQGQGSAPDVEQQVANQHYIELAQPSAVLALIAENERLQREEKNDAIAYKAAIERQEELRTERNLLKADNEALRKVAKELRRWACCPNLDHDKADQHEIDEDCKVLARIDAVMSKPS